MDETIILIVLPPIAAAIGFVLKLGFDSYKNRKERIRIRDTERLKYKLDHFYYPLFFRLLRERDINADLVEICRKENKEDIVSSIESEIFENHKKIQQIIHDGIVKANPIQEIRNELLLYDKHVTYYDIIRNQMGLTSSYPREYNAPYPTTLLEKIEKRINELATQYDNLDEYV